MRRLIFIQLRKGRCAAALETLKHQHTDTTEESELGYHMDRISFWRGSLHVKISKQGVHPQGKSPMPWYLTIDWENWEISQNYYRKP